MEQAPALSASQARSRTLKVRRIAHYALSVPPPLLRLVHYLAPIATQEVTHQLRELPLALHAQRENMQRIKDRRLVRTATRGKRPTLFQAWPYLVRRVQRGSTLQRALVLAQNAHLAITLLATLLLVLPALVELSPQLPYNPRARHVEEERGLQACLVLLHAPTVPQALFRRGA